MTTHEEVLAFAREYVNKPKSRTTERKRKIKEVYVQVFGSAFNFKCGSCYIAAILKLVNQQKPKTSINGKPVIKQNKMTNNYHLKPGALLKAFNDKSKFATNDNLTDELAEWHLAHNPACAKLFSRRPANVQIKPVTNLTSVPIPEVIEEVIMAKPKLEIVTLPEEETLDTIQEELEQAPETVHKELKTKSVPRKAKK